MNLRKLETARFLEYSDELKRIEKALIEEGFSYKKDLELEFVSVLGFKVKVNLGIISSVQYVSIDDDMNLDYELGNSFTYPLNEVEDEVIELVKVLIGGDAPLPCAVCA